MESTLDYDAHHSTQARGDLAQVTTGHEALRALPSAGAQELGTEEVPTHFVQTIR